MTLSPRNRHGITEFQNGSYIAVKELYDEHYTALVDFARQLVIDKAEAHHIVQDAFIKLFFMRDRFDSLPNIKAFLYITVRNICFACIRSEKEIEAGGDPAWYVQALRSEARFDEEEARREALGKIHSQVMELPEPEKNAFTLIFYHRLTIPAAAERSGITPVSAVQHRIQAIRLLRNKLAAADLYSIPLFIYFVAVATQNFEVQ
jgi:RNA polymerase sigma-70 factor (ECF subfamily)